MSGGSFDYLYAKEVDEIFSLEHQMQRMADVLVSLSYAQDAAKETQEFIQICKMTLFRLGVLKGRLEGVWKAMEWWKSGDWGEEQFKKALQLYRGQPKP